MLIWNSIALSLRFILALFLVSVLSPLPDIPGTASRELLAMLSRMEGATSLVIWKSQYSITLFKGASPVKTYWAVFGKGYGDGDKERSGDKRTPEHNNPRPHTVNGAAPPPAGQAPPHRATGVR